MSFNFRPRPGDWLLSNSILRQAEREIFKNAKPNREYDIPYVAGYSKDGRTFYIDQEMPKGFDDQGTWYDTDLPITLHEVIEKSLMVEEHGIIYELAHQIALRGEEAAVKASGMTWAAYNSFCMKQIKLIGERDEYPDCPPDLDLTPYIDEKDWATLRKMKANGKPLWNGSKSISTP